MTIEAGEAAAALDAVARSRRYAGELKGYAQAGSIVIGWGIAWLVANGVTQFDPAVARWIWPLAIGLAALWSMTRPRTGGADWRIPASVSVAVCFVILMLVLTRADPRLVNAVISLVVAASYLVLGIWTGARFAVIGAVLAAAVMVGWFVVPGWLFGCLAVFGGGTLILGGWWLRRA